MSSLKKIKQIMELKVGMCDISEVAENHIHLKSWNENVPKTDLDLIAELIASDGFAIEGFALVEIPHPHVFCFANYAKDQYFDVVKFQNIWHFSYGEDQTHKIAQSIEEAIEKYQIVECENEDE